MPLDMTNTPVPMHLELWVICEEPSWDILEEKLRDAAETCASLDWSVSHYSAKLYYPSADDGSERGDRSEFCVSSVPYDDIASGDLEKYRFH